MRCSGRSMAPSRPATCPSTPTFASFADGHPRCCSETPSASRPVEGRWVDVARDDAASDITPPGTRRNPPHEARLPDRPVPRDAPDGRGRLGRRATASRASRSPAGRALRVPTAPVRGHQSHIDVADLSDAARGPRTSRTRSAAKGLGISGLGFYPNPLHPDPAHRAAGHRPSEAGHRGRRARCRVPVREHVHGWRRGKTQDAELGGGAHGLAGHRARSPRTTGSA